MLADDLRAHGLVDPDLSRHVLEAQKFVIDPTLLDAVAHLRPAEIDATAYLARLPFPMTWIEYQFHEGGDHRRVGVLCHQVAGSAGTAFWMTTISRLAVDHETRVVARRLRVDVVDPGVIHFQGEGIVYPLAVTNHETGNAEVTDIRNAGIARIILGALIFLAARGGARSETVHHDARLQRSREKVGKPPLYSYARLRIDVSRSPSEPSEDHSHGARTPMRGHTVRGHLMHTRAGLLVWRRPHIRGDIARGFVVKTYDLTGSPTP